MPHIVTRVAARAALVFGFLAIGLLATVAAASAQDRRQDTRQDARQNEPGKFDLYLLSLSWSPSFCAAGAERFPQRSGQDPQCGQRPFSFVVHGLWPQYERGFPEFCQVPSPRLNHNIVSSMLDLMPSPRLIFHEWDRHGTCSGLPAAGFFENVRKARAVVKIPPEYMDLQSTLTVTPDEVKDAFVKANTGLTPDGMSIACGSPRLDEIRFCLTRDLQFRDCPASERRACRRDKLVMPPVRGG